MFELPLLLNTWKVTKPDTFVPTDYTEYDLPDDPEMADEGNGSDRSHETEIDKGMVNISHLLTLDVHAPTMVKGSALVLILLAVLLVVWCYCSSKKWFCCRRRSGCDNDAEMGMSPPLMAAISNWLMASSKRLWMPRISARPRRKATSQWKVVAFVV